MVELLIYIFLFATLYLEVFLLISLLMKRRRISAPSPSIPLPSACVIVPCFNEARSVRATLDSLLALSYPKEKFEIIVVDDGSTDGTYEAATRYARASAPRVRVLRKENGGKHTALNYALARTDAELVGCLDADSTVAPDALLRAARSFRSLGIVAVTPGIHVRSPKTLLQHLQHVEYLLSVFNRCAFAGTGSVFITPGPFTIFRSSVLREVGGWRHAHSTEDMEIALRLQEKGYGIANNPRIAVYTTTPATLRGLVKQRVRWSYGFLRNILDYRHMLGNRAYGNLGIIILPAALMSIGTSIFFALHLLSEAGHGALRTWARFSAGGTVTGNFDPFFLDTSVMLFSILATIVLTVVLISFGSYLSTGSRRLPLATPLFLVLYGIIVPVWVSIALVKAVRGRGVAWR